MEEVSTPATPELAQDIAPATQDMLPTTQDINPVTQEISPIAQNVATVAQEIREVCRLVWGPVHSTDNEIGSLFERWTQPFVFSQDDSAALVQEQGGPCAILAPVQAYIVKHVLFDRNADNMDCVPEEAEAALGAALHAILRNIATDTVCLVALPDPPATLSSIQFHKTVVHRRFPVSELSEHISEYVSCMLKKYGVLCFLYSVVLTRTVTMVTADLGAMGDDCLIDSTFGHGNQSLLNLLITGIATPNVFDLTRDVAGLELVGVQKQTEIGFLTLLEALRYLKVGDFLKSPTLPIWILGSEGHLTVLFAKDRTLCGTEDTPFKLARSVFDSFDDEGNGFIPVTELPKILEQLNMCCEEEYVSFMADRLDPESTGIILFNAFLKEFVPGATHDTLIQNKQFNVWHYNGLKQSNHDNKIKFIMGLACVYLEYNQFMDAGTAPTPILRVLRTKWPTVEVDWNVTPSIS